MEELRGAAEQIQQIALRREAAPGPGPLLTRPFPMCGVTQQRTPLNFCAPDSGASMWDGAGRRKELGLFIQHQELVDTGTEVHQALQMWKSA